ncbi:MAG: hypothetical protein HY834_02405 [Devosia nanyangense]|uniref:Uncharacterized protein n=1 Tax=Devosia nanyangense TaxID=1228055 RepID=A0A933KXS4_9HYPH|nr:hypothetical protein [Devosia nanyangense]
MHTLMIVSSKQGIAFNEAAAVAPFAIIEKLSSLAGQVLKAARSPSAPRSAGPVAAQA